MGWNYPPETQTFGEKGRTLIETKSQSNIAYFSQATWLAIQYAPAVKVSRVLKKPGCSKCLGAQKARVLKRSGCSKSLFYRLTFGDELYLHPAELAYCTIPRRAYCTIPGSNAKSRSTGESRPIHTLTRHVLELRNYCDVSIKCKFPCGPKSLLRAKDTPSLRYRIMTDYPLGRLYNMGLSRRHQQLAVP